MADMSLVVVVIAPHFRLSKQKKKWKIKENNSEKSHILKWSGFVTFSRVSMILQLQILYTVHSHQGTREYLSNCEKYSFWVKLAGATRESLKSSTKTRNQKHNFLGIS